MKKHLFIMMALALLLPSCKKSSGTIVMQFDSSQPVSSCSWALRDIAPGLPSDWSDYNYLVLEMKASSPQRFSIGPVTAGGFLPKNIQPFAGAWLRFTIPLDFFRELPASAVDMAATYNKARKLGQINIHSHQTGTLTGIDSIRFYMKNPVDNPTLGIRAITLAVDDPGEALLEDVFLVDRFGQWATKDWDGKVKSEEDLQAAWREEDGRLQTALFPGDEVSQYGGYRARQRKATGFFRTEKIDGKWWFVDPEGCLFLSVGADCINASVRTTTKDRAFVFEHLPETEGYADFYRWNIRRRYGEGNESEWINTAISRMHAWGLNTVANWSSREMTDAGRMPFVLTLPGLQLEKGVMGLPDVYDPQYARDIDGSIGEMARRYRDNPWLLGYFVGNEQPWPGQESVLCDRILNGGDTPIKKALASWIGENGDSFESRRAFVYGTFDRFLGLVNRVLKTYDPNHLNLGMRFGGHTSNGLLSVTARHFDVFSFNCYEVQPSVEFMERIDEMTGLPILIGEYHFGVPDRGMAAGIVQAANYRERGNAYRYYNEQGYHHPSLVGAHWFQWIDQANTGRMDGENYNIGLLDITDRPYPDMVDAMKETHARLFRIHAGEQHPYDTKPKASGY
ncbi:MAG: hypothetical protein LBJ47_05125 [Tannerella sp.]|jgi:hypothetical protein|nr:hypothetical protein [Tannerella sp.]